MFNTSYKQWIVDQNLQDINVLKSMFEVVKSAKILGLTVRDDLKWNDNINNVTVKAPQRVYHLKQLKRADIHCISLLQFYCTCIRLVLECACQSLHSSLPAYLSDQLERIQKRSLRVIYPDLSEALTKSSMSTFQDRRELLCRKLFMEIVDNKAHKLHQLLPPLNATTYKTRNSRAGNLVFHIVRQRDFQVRL